MSLSDGTAVSNDGSFAGTNLGSGVGVEVTNAAAITAAPGTYGTTTGGYGGMAVEPSARGTLVNDAGGSITDRAFCRVSSGGSGGAGLGPLGGGFVVDTRTISGGAAGDGMPGTAPSGAPEEAAYSGTAAR